MDPNNGNLVISDTHNHRIQVLSSAGVFLKMFGQHGTARGHLSYTMFCFLHPPYLPHEVHALSAVGLGARCWGSVVAVSPHS